MKPELATYPAAFSLAFASLKSGRTPTAWLSSFCARWAQARQERLHLDIKPVNGDRAAELDRLLGLGARPVDVGQGARNWFVLTDPEGNEFCLCRP